MWAALLPAFLLAPGVRANTTLFNDSGSCTANAPCWQAQDFGILVGVGQTLTATNDIVAGSPTAVIINGAVGVGANGTTTGKITESGSSNYEVWTGPIDFADATAANGVDDPECPTGDTCSVATGTNIRKVSLTGGVTNLGDTTGNYNEPGVTSALTDVTSISNYWKAQTGAGTITESTLGATSGQITIGTGSTGVIVYNVSSINLSNAGLLIDAAAGSLVVINDSGSASFSATGSGKFYVSLEGGITADDVLFNIDSLSSTLTISGTNGSYLDADFMVAGAYNVSHATLDGRLLGWGTNAGTLGAAFVVDAPPNYTPEPEDWLLMASGLGVFGYVYRKQLRLNRNFALGTHFRERIEADAGESGRCVRAAAGRTAGAGGGDGAPPSELGIPPPRGGGGGGSGGVDLAREP